MSRRAVLASCRSTVTEELLAVASACCLQCPVATTVHGQRPSAVVRRAGQAFPPLLERSDLCSAHLNDWVAARERGIGKAAFVTAAHGLDRHVGVEEIACRICPERPAAHTELRLCQRHLSRWANKQAGKRNGFAEWLSGSQSSSWAYDPMS